MPGHSELALYSDSEHNGGRLRRAAEQRGLAVVELPKDPTEVAVVPRPGLAWRAPLGLMATLVVRGLPIRLAAPGPDWFAALPVDVLGRALDVVTAEKLMAGAARFDVRMVKLADAKLSGFAAARVRGAAAAAEVVDRASLPADSRLLIADAWLECDSEYRVFCIGKEPVTCSPYLVEGEAWGPLLTQHHASFHEEATAFAADVLTSLGEQDIPPACVLDVARLPNGRLVLLEANTTWGAGLYGCDPLRVLEAVLAANEPVDPAWLWTPDPLLVQRASHHLSSDRDSGQPG